MSYSLESFVRAYSAAVQSMWEKLAGLEHITRPPVRHTGIDEDAAGEPISDVVLCPTDGGRCECDRTSQGCLAYHTAETKLADLKADRGTGAINDGEPQQVTLSGREFERYLEGALNEPYIAPDDETNRCYFCGDPTENLVNADDDPEFVCEDCCGDTPNPTEPGLDDAELVGVRGLLQERYEPSSQAKHDSRIASAALNRFLTGTGTGASCRCGHGMHYGNICLACGCSAAQPTSAPVKSTPGTGAGSNAPADYGTAGSSPSDACDIPPSPSEGRPPHPVPREQRIGTYCEDYETDGCSVDVCPEGCWQALKLRDDAAAEWIGGAVPVITAVLADHHYWSNGLHCKCGAGIGDGIDPFDWRQHVAPFIANALAPQPKPAFPETGYDMGISLEGCTHAAEVSPQQRHTK